MAKPTGCTVALNKSNGQKYWVARYYDAYGKRRLIKGAIGSASEMSRAQAQKLANAKLAEIRKASASITDQAPTLEKYIEAQLEIYKANDSAPSYIDSLEVSRDYLYRKFGRTLPIDQLTIVLVDEWYKDLIDGKLSPIKKKPGLHTISRVVRHASTLFSHAEKRKQIPLNPFKLLDCRTPKVDKDNYVYQPVKTFVDKVLPKCPNIGWAMVFVLLRGLGLRHNEVDRVLIKDVHLKQRCIKIKNPKHHQTTKHRTRYAGIPAWCVPYITTALTQAQRADHTADSRLIEGALLIRSRRKATLRIIRTAGVEPWPDLFQMMRRMARRDYKESVGPELASVWLGHSTKVGETNYDYADSDGVHDFHAPTDWGGPSEATPLRLVRPEDEDVA